MATVRKLVDSGNYSEATVVADKELSGEASDVCFSISLFLVFHFYHPSSYALCMMVIADLAILCITIPNSEYVFDLKYSNDLFGS